MQIPSWKANKHIPQPTVPRQECQYVRANRISQMCANWTGPAGKDCGRAVVFWPKETSRKNGPMMAALRDANRPPELLVVSLRIHADLIQPVVGIMKSTLGVVGADMTRLQMSILLPDARGRPHPICVRRCCVVLSRETDDLPSPAELVLPGVPLPPPSHRQPEFLRADRPQLLCASSPTSLSTSLPPSLPVSPALLFPGSNAPLAFELLISFPFPRQFRFPGGRYIC
ncbi:hypothetical protein F5B21DRAFT_228387 [Xylaria acuta]|nr:hypothetical protein F5B21DRAFT_228387 [Xylaria acuta]